MTGGRVGDRVGGEVAGGGVGSGVGGRVVGGEVGGGDGGGVGGGVGALVVGVAVSMRSSLVRRVTKAAWWLSSPLSSRYGRPTVPTTMTAPCPAVPNTPDASIATPKPRLPPASSSLLAPGNSS